MSDARSSRNVCSSAPFWLLFVICVQTLLMRTCPTNYPQRVSLLTNTLLLTEYVIDRLKLSRNKRIERFCQLSAIPSGQFDDVPWLDEAAQLVPDRNCNAPGLIRHFTWANFVSIFCFSHSPWQKNKKKGCKIKTPLADRNFATCSIASVPVKEPDGSWWHADTVHAVGTGANYLPISRTMNTIFKFFDPGFTSFIKTKASVVGLAIVNFLKNIY